MFKLTLVSLMFMVVSIPALAQEDFPLKPSVEGKHPLRVEIFSNQPLASLCIDRVDVDPPVELICLPDPPFATGSIIELLVPLAVTPGVVVEIRARVTSVMAIPSDYSPNAAIADFTKPAAPVLLFTP